MAGHSLILQTRQITEIACHGRGAFFLNNSVRTVLDIGGQDSKAISLDEQGSVTDFVMNDKCAAGTGRFLEVMAHLLGGEVQDLDRMAAGAEAQVITNMCTVFAESEVISLLAKGVSKESIARGILESIAGRAAALLGRVSVEPRIAFTGGASRSAVLKELIEQKIRSTAVCVAARPDCRSPWRGNNRLERAAAQKHDCSGARTKCKGLLTGTSWNLYRVLLRV